MTARLLEENGIATVVIGAARDIVEWCGVPRFLFSDLPLGNPLGVPGDRTMQRDSVALALGLVAEATAPVVRETGFRWSDDDSWKDNYMRIDDSNRELLKRLGEENRAKRKAEREAGLARP
ncbi:MAG: hypothetical protein ACFHX7_23340 [Pseudomonadota bacterium]